MKKFTIPIVLAFGFFLLLSCFFFWQIQDEPLLSELQVILSPPERPPEQDNGFYFLMGFSVPFDQDPHKEGMDLVSRYEVAHANQKGTIDFAYQSAESLAPLSESSSTKAQYTKP